MKKETVMKKEIAMKELKYKHFKYASDLVDWVNKNSIEVVSISDAGRFSEGQNLYYRLCQE